ncbi:MAG: hypothetical protein Q9168_006135 [Polycauliona sp. 1 TL-2023]
MSEDYRPLYGNIARTKQHFQEHKDAYRRQRDTFRSDPRAPPELQAWRNRDNDFNYHLLNQSGKAFIPSGLVGKNPLNMQPWAKSDTFFSVLLPPNPQIAKHTNPPTQEYMDHNDPALVLSESEHSYIIGNMASYDGRQYILAPTEKRPEGQGFCHTLVIPKTRIYNAVDPLATMNDCFVLRELREHFLAFFRRRRGRACLLKRARKAVEDRDGALISPKSGAEPRNPEYTDAVRQAIFDDFERMQHEFWNLSGPEDFIFGLHVFPENSIGHLHMHVFPYRDSLRTASTKDYDYKTVPLNAIVEVEMEDAAEALVMRGGDVEQASSNGEGPSQPRQPTPTPLPPEGFTAVNK